MKILIIEDEIKTAKSLARMIQTIDTNTFVIDILQSISSSILWFNQNDDPDLIFMDIQLADGLSFEIFEKVNINTPVVFCTAFNDYAIQAFKSNGIDYILKPFNIRDIESALEKVRNLKNYFQKNVLPTVEISKLLMALPSESTKKSFLVYNQNSYINIATSAIVYFYKGLNGINMVTEDKKRYLMNESLDEIHRLVGKQFFYRINRQYLVAFKSITEVQHYFNRRLILKLMVETDEKLTVGREKANEFLEWLGNR